MEPRALASANTTPFRDPKDLSNDAEPAQRVLSELSIDRGKYGSLVETEMKKQMT